MKKLLNRFQTTLKALQLLSEPEVMQKLGVSHREDNEDLSKGQFIFHKHFIVQVIG